MVDATEVHMRGQFITAGGGKVTMGRDPSKIHKGMHLTSTPAPRKHYIGQADAIQLIAERLQAVRKQIEDITAGVKRR